MKNLEREISIIINLFINPNGPNYSISFYLSFGIIIYMLKNNNQIQINKSLFAHITYIHTCISI